MNDKSRMLVMLGDEFNRWEELLAGLGVDQITAIQPSSILSIKDVIAHLRAWQQISIARLEAAQRNEQPVFPDWLAESDPKSDEELDQYNARIFKTYHQQPWSGVYQDWRDGFIEFQSLGEEIPENDLMDAKKYAWLKGYALIDVLEGSYEHHQEHLDGVLDWLRDAGRSR